MSGPNATTAISTLLSMALLWILAMWLYRSYRVAYFRNEMFALRDSLFDLARTGKIPFDHKAYTTLRSMCNGYIRFGERLTVSSLTLFRLGLDGEHLAYLRARPDLNERLAEMTNDLPDDVRRALREHKSKMHDLVAGQLVFGSPLLVATLLPPALMWAILRLHMRVIQRMRRYLRRAIADKVDEAALAMGESLQDRRRVA